jgi:hypothetical protein
MRWQCVDGKVEGAARTYQVARRDGNLLSDIGDRVQAEMNGDARDRGGAVERDLFESQYSIIATRGGPDA